MSKLRTFLALTLDGAARDELVRHQRRLQAGLQLEVATLRLTRPEQLHVTLTFLGDTAEALVPQITSVVGEVARRHAPFELAIERLLYLPKPTRAQVIAVGLADLEGRAASLASDLSNGLTPLGFTFEQRRFLAHITLFRSKTPFRGQLAFPLGSERTTGDTVLRLGQIAHYASHLEATGARYELLSQTPLETILP